MSRRALLPFAGEGGVGANRAPHWHWALSSALTEVVGAQKSINPELFATARILER